MTPPLPENPSEAELSELAALADGSIERQRAALAALATLRGELEAPPRLRARIEARRGESRSGSRWPVIGVAVAAVAAAVLAFAILPGGEPGVEEAAELAARPAAGPAPPPEPETPALLAANVEGVAFPNWKPEFGWRAAGERGDELDGRRTRTVFYEKEDARLSYTIVSGDPLDAPDGETTNVDGVEFTTFDAGAGERGVTWLRDGHTCVLVGHDVDEPTLIKLAAWKGDGAVGF
ncbi:MAG: hypothetical protein ABWZ43_09875 [Solirubrobacterales bacterium]